MKQITLVSLALLAMLVPAGCGSEGSAPSKEPEVARAVPTNYDVMRDKVILGLAKDFRASTHIGTRRYGLCVRLGMRRTLTPERLDRLVAIHGRPDGRQLAAQALNALAAPIGAGCGGARYVPELVTAAAALADDYPLSRFGIAARRLGIAYGPYLGVSCQEPGSTGCERVGLDVVLRRDARAVTAWVGGRRMVLRTPGQHNGEAGRDWVGYLDHVGFRQPESPFFIASADGDRVTWTGSTAVYLPVRLEIVHPGETIVGGALPRIQLSPGWG